MLFLKTMLCTKVVLIGLAVLFGAVAWFHGYFQATPGPLPVTLTSVTIAIVTLLAGWAMFVGVCLAAHAHPKVQAHFRHLHHLT